MEIMKIYLDICRFRIGDVALFVLCWKINQSSDMFSFYLVHLLVYT